MAVEIETAAAAGPPVGPSGSALKRYATVSYRLAVKGGRPEEA